jgi:hypothetical protein
LHQQYRSEGNVRLVTNINGGAFFAYDNVLYHTRSTDERRSSIHNHFQNKVSRRACDRPL